MSFISRWRTELHNLKNQYQFNKQLQMYFKELSREEAQENIKWWWRHWDLKFHNWLNWVISIKKCFSNTLGSLQEVFNLAVYVNYWNLSHMATKDEGFRLVASLSWLDEISLFGNTILCPFISWWMVISNLGVFSICYTLNT